MGKLVFLLSTNERTFGIGLKFKKAVMDLDGATFSTITGDDYAIMRLFGDYQITETIKLVGRIENLMDENYAEVDGYPALGRAIHAGLSFSF